MPVFLVRKALITVLLMPVVPIAQAQTAGEHQHSMMGKHQHPMMMMESSAPLGLSMSRIGSGTAWQPDSTPMPGIDWQPGGGWEVMLHWNLLGGFDAQTTSRGDPRRPQLDNARDVSRAVNHLSRADAVRRRHCG